MQNYRKKSIQPMQPWDSDIDMDFVSVSEPDKLNGSPKEGDMIAINPKDISDMWLVAKTFFEDNYEVVEA